MSQKSPTKAFKLKGRLYTLTVMQLVRCDQALFLQQLTETISQAPRLFEGIPLVLDCTDLGEEPIDLKAICDCLRQHNLFPVALQGTGAWVKAFAQEAEFALLNSSASQDKAWVEPEYSPPASPVEKPPTAPRTKCHTLPVRSGQQLVAKGTDLLVLGSVSPGAELLSEGHIYVYGTLRGRALAGMSGEKQARIFCQGLEAELISIAGVYRLNESMEWVDGPCQIYLQDDRIVVEPICRVP